MRSVWLVAIAGCGRIGFTEHSDGGAPCAYGPWTAPVELGTNNADVTKSVNTQRNEVRPSLAADALTLIFQSNRVATNGAWDLYQATRATAADAFGDITNLVALNTNSGEGQPELSVDGRTLYLTRSLAGNRLFRATRAGPADAFGTPTQVSELAGEEVWAPELLADGSGLYYTTATPDVMMYAVFAQGAFTVTGPVAELNAGGTAGYATVSADGLELYFTSTRLGTYDLFVATRAEPDAPFDPPVLVTELSLPTANDDDPELSKDGRTMIFASDRGPLDDLGFRQHDLFASTRECQ